MSRAGALKLGGVMAPATVEMHRVHSDLSTRLEVLCPSFCVERTHTGAKAGISGSTFESKCSLAVRLTTSWLRSISHLASKWTPLSQILRYPQVR